jgi:NAD-dependent dihydropyrimidine dehydrogenase PreA subunit
MTVAQFSQTNQLPDTLVKKAFNLSSDADLEKKITEFGAPREISSLISGKLALAAEHAGKNWLKIRLKFACWLLFLSFVFIHLRRRKLTPSRRIWLLYSSVFVFGVALGADPGPMGTVKDAIHLYGTEHVIFPPRMIALALFLALVLLANKYICAWGCQAGTLQELIYRINSTDKQQPRIGKQHKLPFVVTNTFRILFFGAFVLAVFLRGTDIIAPLDPFKIYNPKSLALSGGIFIGALLLGSLFVYRPWCHLFCPFGLVGWLLERISRVKITVDYQTCIACQKCAEACPSTVMGAILRRDKQTIPDCFACYTCRDVCPTGSVQFSNNKRSLPPTDHFTKDNQNSPAVE